MPVFEANILELAPIPQARTCAACFSVGGQVYVFAGRATDGKYANNLLRYDPQQNQWIDLGSTPLQARVYPIAVVMNDEVYIGLGYNGGSIYGESYLRDFWRYNPQSNEWQQLQDYPDHRTNSATAFAVNGFIYAGLGFNGFTERFYRYDPQKDEWTTNEQKAIPNFPQRCTGATAAVVGQRPFVGTGFRQGSHSEWYEYIADKNSWKKRKSVPTKGRHFAATAATDDALYMFGGWHYGDTLTGGFYFDDILRYEPEDNSWSVAGAVPTGKTINMVATSIGSTIYFGLGENVDQKPLNRFFRIEK